MSECTDKQLGRLLHAYEWGMLSSSDQDALEAHLIDCSYCQKEARQLMGASELLREDPDLKPFLRDLGSQETDMKRPHADRPGVISDRARWSYLWRAAAVAAVLVLVLILKPWDIEFRPSLEAIAAENRVVVMCVNNLPQDEKSDWMSDAITNLLISDLSESRYVQVVANPRLYAVLRRLGVSTLDTADGELITDVARETRAGWVLLCNILQVQPKIMLTVQLIEVLSGDVAASHRLEHEGDVFSLVDSLTVLVKDDLSLPLAAREEYDPSIADVTTQSAEAYRWYLEGIDNYGKKYFKEAEDCYRRAVHYDSTFAMAHYCLVWHDVPGALERAVRYSKNATHKEQLYIKSLQASRQGDIRQAAKLLEELVQRYPDEKVAWMELAYYAKIESRYEEAVHYLQQSLEADPYYGDAMSLLAYTYLDMDDFRQAMATANAYLELEPEEPDPYDTRGEIYATYGMLDDAIADYEMATQLKPDFANYRSLVNLGRLYVFKGEYERARSCFRQVIAVADIQTRLLARVCLPMVSLYQGKLAQGLSELDDAIAADRLEMAATTSRNYAALKYRVRSKILLKTGDLSGAITAVDDALALVGEEDLDLKVRYLVHYAYVLEMGGHSERVQQVLAELRQDIAKEGTDRESYWKALGMVSFVRGDLPRAIENLEKLTDPEVHISDSRFFLARAYMDSQRLEEASAEFEKILINFNDWRRFFGSTWPVEAYYYSALTEERLGHVSVAVERYEKFLEIWANADKSLTLVADARARLSQLKAGS